MNLKSASLTALLSVAEAAKLLGVSEKTIHRQIKAGILRCHRVGRQIRFTEVNIRNYLAAGLQ